MKSPERIKAAYDHFEAAARQATAEHDAECYEMMANMAMALGWVLDNKCAEPVEAFLSNLPANLDMN